jgi:hypothetical protein
MNKIQQSFAALVLAAAGASQANAAPILFNPNEAPPTRTGFAYTVDNLNNYVGPVYARRLVGDAVPMTARTSRHFGAVDPYPGVPSHNSERVVIDTNARLMRGVSGEPLSMRFSNHAMPQDGGGCHGAPMPAGTPEGTVSGFSGFRYMTEGAHLAPIGFQISPDTQRIIPHAIVAGREIDVDIDRDTIQTSTRGNVFSMKAIGAMAATNQLDLRADLSNATSYYSCNEMTARETVCVTYDIDLDTGRTRITADNNVFTCREEELQGGFIIPPTSAYVPQGPNYGPGYGSGFAPAIGAILGNAFGSGGGFYGRPGHERHALNDVPHVRSPHGPRDTTTDVTPPVRPVGTVPPAGPGVTPTTSVTPQGPLVPETPIWIIPTTPIDYNPYTPVNEIPPTAVSVGGTSLGYMTLGLVGLGGALLYVRRREDEVEPKAAKSQSYEIGGP